jgi:hypothetical protein
MKKLLTILFAVGLFYSTNLFAQDAASGTWDLLVDSTGVAAGNVEVADQSKSPDLFVKDYTGGAMFGNAQRLWLGGVNWETDTTNFSRWVQFQVTPKAGFDFTITKITFFKGSYGTHGGMHANMYWDLDTTFSTTGTLLDTTGQSRNTGLPDVRDRDCPIRDTAVSIVVPDGKTFYLRFYPWYSAGSSSSKYLVLGNIIIEGTTATATAVEDEATIPTQFALKQNYPNPFNPTTNIQFDLPESGNYSLKVYNLLGQEVATLVNGALNAGVHSVNFDASKLTSGMYIYQLSGNNVNLTRKMLLMK